MKTNTITWKIYKLLFLDIWHHQFFNSSIKPQNTDFSGDKLDQYLDDLNIDIKAIASDNFDNYENRIKSDKKIIFSSNQKPTLFYANHPSSLDALFIFVLLKKVDLYFISFLHNTLHFRFLENRLIPVAAYFRSKKLDILGLKMKFGKFFEDMTEREAGAMNRQVVSKAVEKLAHGSCVTIFPSGGWGPWKDGIGFIISQFREKYPDRELILQSLKNDSFLEIHSVAHSLLHWFGIKTKAVVKIKVGQEIFLSNLSKEPIFQIKNEKQRAKAIKAYLEDSYK